MAHFQPNLLGKTSCAFNDSKSSFILKTSPCELHHLPILNNCTDRTDGYHKPASRKNTMRQSPISHRCTPLPLLYTPFTDPLKDLKVFPFWWVFTAECPLLIPLLIFLLAWPLFCSIVSRCPHDAAMSPINTQHRIPRKKLYQLDNLIATSWQLKPGDRIICILSDQNRSGI